MLNFNYELIDNNQDSTIMLLHGFLSSKESMRDIAAGLSDLRNIILVDLPGFGGTNSTAQQYGMKDVAAGLVSVADRHGIKTFDVLGYSMGGAVAQLVWRQRRRSVFWRRRARHLPRRGPDRPAQDGRRRQARARRAARRLRVVSDRSQ